MEANALTQQLKSLPDPKVKVDTDHVSPYIYKIGDQVEIVNNYRRKKGTKGVVTHVSKSLVTLQDETRKLHTRKHTNLKKL